MIGRSPISPTKPWLANGLGFVPQGSVLVPAGASFSIGLVVLLYDYQKLFLMNFNQYFLEAYRRVLLKEQKSYISGGTKKNNKRTQNKLRILSRNCKKNCKNGILATILTNNIFLLILLISSARRGKTAIRWAYRGFQELLACRGLSRTLERGGPTDDAWTRNAF